MLFPTIDFAIFFILIFASSWLTIRRPLFRKIMLLAASFFFYAYWDSRFATILLACSIANYTVGLAFDVFGESKRKLVVTIGVIGNLCVLGYFKYCGFFVETFNEMLFTFGVTGALPTLEIVLPVGVSFYTFQGISYVVDVYRKDIKASESPIDVLLYIAFFPQLIAGPIVRASHFLPQLNRSPDPGMIEAGRCFLLIGLGLFKKLVVANYLATDLVTPIFQDPAAYSSTDAIFGLYGFAIQIFCDFSAYSDIAIGAAGLLGYHFPDNFDQPYKADSLQNFWRRWHISLSTWLKDYLYYPLGGSRGGEFKTNRNLFLVMFMAGIWHGAAWTFIIFGTAHGLWLVAERQIHKRFKKSTLASPGFRLINGIITFHFVCFTLAFFAADSIQISWAYLATLFAADFTITAVTPFSVGLILVGLAMNLFPKKIFDDVHQMLVECPAPVQAVVIGLFFLIIGVLGPNGIAPFIYYRF